MDPYRLTTNGTDTVSLTLIPRTATPARMVLGVEQFHGVSAATELDRDEAFELAQRLEEFARNLDL